MGTPSFELNLDPAAVLYLKKISLRTRVEITTHATELPFFAWSIEKANIPGVSDKDLTRNFMRALASAWRAMQKPDSDGGFVALIKVSTSEDRFGIQIHCPFKQVLAPLTDPVARKMVADDTAASTVNIQHKFALIDTRCPVVFLWRHATDDVLITNDFHFGNPRQFLAIDRVGTTSGFLNFIGALNLLVACGEEAGFVSRVPDLLKDAMAARADEWLRWLMHQVQKRVVFDPKRVLVDSRHPETYFYDYCAEPI